MASNWGRHRCDALCALLETTIDGGPDTSYWFIPSDSTARRILSTGVFGKLRWLYAARDHQRVCTRHHQCNFEHHRVDEVLLLRLHQSVCLAANSWLRGGAEFF